MFLEELPKDSFIQLNEDSLSENSVKNLEIILSPKDSPAIFTGEKVFFEKVIKNFKLSVTALNTYLKDRDEFIHNVLLKVPRAKPAPMAFGTAVHYALEQMYKNKMNGKSISLEAVLKAFEESLIKELITKSEFERRLTYGKNILSKYFDEYKGAEIDPIFVERFFGFGFSKTILDDIPLIGRIDRIDWIDKKDRTVRVVDYKTGRSRSVNEIEGKTKSAGLSERELSLPESIRGPYKRQLVFYKLLCDLDQSFTPNVAEGVFDFVQPDDITGKFTQRSIDITPEDVGHLKNLIREVMAEIRSLKFLD
jgi:DNA helicase-2/ATP-dependent DNA helicase PcrA